MISSSRNAPGRDCLGRNAIFLQTCISNTLYRSCAAVFVLWLMLVEYLSDALSAKAEFWIVDWYIWRARDYARRLFTLGLRNEPGAFYFWWLLDVIGRGRRPCELAVKIRLVVPRSDVMKQGRNDVQDYLLVFQVGFELPCEWMATFTYCMTLP